MIADRCIEGISTGSQEGRRLAFLQLYISCMLMCMPALTICQPGSNSFNPNFAQVTAARSQRQWSGRTRRAPSLYGSGAIIARTSGILGEQCCNFHRTCAKEKYIPRPLVASPGVLVAREWLISFSPGACPTKIAIYLQICAGDVLSRNL